MRTPLTDIAIDKALEGDGQELRELCRQFEDALLKISDLSVVARNDKLVKAARAVVTARHHQGKEAWDLLKNAIAELEGVVGNYEH